MTFGLTRIITSRTQTPCSISRKGAQLTNPLTRRAAAAAALATSLLVAFAALGGVSAGQSAISADQYQYGKKVTICHKGKKTISIAKAAWPAHQRHGDTLGTCASAAAKAAKAKKAKAAKAKAEAAKAKAAEKKPEQAGNPGKGKGGKG